jgi:hypothetical protein
MPLPQEIGAVIRNEGLAVKRKVPIRWLIKGKVHPASNMLFMSRSIAAPICKSHDSTSADFLDKS